MTRWIRAIVPAVLAVFLLPLYAFSDEPAPMGKKSATAQGTRKPVDSHTRPSAPSAEQSRKPSPQDDVQTRGLFSKKKKKKPVGGAAGHTESTEQADLPAHGESRDGK